MAQFLEFAPMLRAMQGRVWRLEPFAVQASVSGAGDAAGVDANLFEDPDGALIAVQKRIRHIPSVPVASRFGQAGTKAMTPLQTTHPKSSLNREWLRIEVLAPTMWRLSGEALVAWSQHTTSRLDGSCTPAAGPVATYFQLSGTTCSVMSVGCDSHVSPPVRLRRVSTS